MKFNELKKLPIYSELWKNRATRQVDSRGVPYLLKSDIVDGFPNNFMSDDFKQAIENNMVEFNSTSGTTSDKMQIVRPLGWWQDEYKRTYKCNPYLKTCIEHNLPKAILTTAICSNSVCFLKSPTYEQRIINGCLYLNIEFNPWNWDQTKIETMVNELNRFKPFYLDVDPIYFYVFLLKLKQFNLLKDLYVPKVITISYEYAPQNIIDYIKANVTCHIINLYGTTEYGYVFIEDSESRLRLCPELLSVDFLPIKNSENIYELVISSSKNIYMPLYNYLPGDLFELTPAQYKNFHKDHLVNRFAGRKKDILNSGDKVIALCNIDDFVSKFKDISLYQLDGSPRDKFIFRYMTTSTTVLPQKDISQLQCGLEELLNKNVDISFVSSIIPEISGKFSFLKDIKKGVI